MSKDRKDQGDWHSGSDAFFRAVRADHEATATDYARVEAELARRLTAGTAEPARVQGDLPTSTPVARTFTFGTVAKVWLGLSLLAAGSYVAMRRLDFVEPRSALVAGSQESSSQPPPSAAPALEPSPEARTEPSVPELSETPQPRARRDAAARATSSRSALRDSSAPKPPSASAGHSRSARADASEAVSAPANASQRGDASSAVAATSAKIGGAASTDASVRETRVQATAASRKKPDAKRPAEPFPSTEPAAAEKPSARSGRAAALLGESKESTDARAELALLERMQAAMRAGEAERALELCAEHATRWPRGVFSEEREAVRAIASCELRSKGAAARAELFLKTHPRAPTAPRVAAACAPLLAAASEPASHK